MTKKITIIAIIIVLMIGGVLLVEKHYKPENTTETTAESTIQSEQVDEKENTEAASADVSSTDTESQIYDIEEITTLEDGFLKLEPDCNYYFNWDTSAIEENEDGSFTGTFNRASVFIPVVITNDMFSSIELGCELPKVDHLAYKWGDFKCIQIQDGKKYFVDSCYDSVDEAKNDDSLTICFDESCKDSKGNIFVCTDSDPDDEGYGKEYECKDIECQVKVKFAADAKIKYMKSIETKTIDDYVTDDITYDTVDFKTFLSEDIMSGYGDFAAREWDVNIDSWHGTGELRATGNEAGELVFIEEFWPAG